VNKQEFEMAWALAQQASLLANQTQLLLRGDGSKLPRAEIEHEALQACQGVTSRSGALLEYMAAVGEQVDAEPAPESILQEAQRLTRGARQGDYGHPLDDFTRTGRMWAAILGVERVTAEQVGLCMVALKISRQCNKPKRDNLVDGAGYMGTVEMVLDERERRDANKRMWIQNATETPRVAEAQYGEVHGSLEGTVELDLGAPACEHMCGGGCPACAPNG
jgi:hypothetical protein